MPTIAGEWINGRGNYIEKVEEVANVPDSPGDAGVSFGICMKTISPKTGYDVEDLVEEICKVIYLSDFVVRSPKYTKQSGKAKEAADFLVPFDKTLLAFQVKSKREIKSAVEKSKIDFQRINVKIEDGVNQLNTIKRALKADHILELNNVAGIKIPFKKENYEELIGIVVIDLLGEEEFPHRERTEILNGFLF